MIDFPVRTVVEGKTKLLVPDVGKEHPAHAPVFYNPAMRFNRDVTVSVMDALRPRNMLDALSGTGAKGIRVLNEAGVDVILNDRNPLAVEFIRKNLELNGLSARVENKDANLLMREEKFYSIDIDPFGTPVTFVDSAFSSIRGNGILGITATDTAALTGTYPSSGIRKYGVLVSRTSFMHELGLRALIGFVVREGAKYNLAMEPILAHSTLHYYRVFFRARPGKQKATKAVRSLAWVVYDRKTDDRWYSRFQDPNYENLGPVWSGPLFDEDLLKSMQPINEDVVRFRSLALSESKYNFPYIDYHILAKKHRLSLVRMDKLREVLESNGVGFSRTHFCPHCFKSDAQPSEIASVLKSKD